MLYCLHQSIDLMTERQLSLLRGQTGYYQNPHLILLIVAILDIVFWYDGLHLTEHGIGKLALNFVKRIRSILRSASAKQKLKEVHSKISSSSDNPRSDKPELIYDLSHKLDEETVKCKKDLAFSASKNSMIMSNFSAKENANVEGKSENERGIQDESQKCENFTDFLFNIRKCHSNKIIMAHVNINSLRNKFHMFTKSVSEYIHILIISEISLATHFHMLYII